MTIRCMEVVIVAHINEDQDQAHYEDRAAMRIK